jgi:hypothetical protein
MSEYNEVFKNTRKFIRSRPNPEKIVEWAYTCYKKEYFKKAELIVRVPHMLAKYHKSPEIINLKRDFKKLFNYYHNRVVKDLKIPNVFEVTKLNREFGVLKKISEGDFVLNPTSDVRLVNLGTEQEKIILFSSEVPKMSLRKLFDELTKLPENKIYVRCKNIFIDSENLKDDHIRNEIKKLSRSVHRLIIDAGDAEELNLPDISEHNTKIFIFAHPENKKLIKSLKVSSHDDNVCWDDLTDISQGKILKKEFEFEGEKFSLENLLKENEKPSSEILHLISFGKLNVKCKSEITEKDPNLIKFDRVIRQKMRFSFIENGVEKFIFNFFDKSLVEFLNAVEKDEKVTVVSDIAGSGKTTLLIDIYEYYKETKPDY